MMSGRITNRKGRPVNAADVPVFFAPFVSGPMRVEPAWIDYNGHLNMAYYHVLFDRAVDEAFLAIGIGPEYILNHEASTFVAEIHTNYRRELTVNDVVRVTLQLIAFDEKRMHYYLEIRHWEECWLAASAEHLALHVDLTTRKVTPFPETIRANLSAMQQAHGALGRPEALGRGIQLGRPRAGNLPVEPAAAEGSP
jgi:acyl-CoA thioester hydrolase